MRARFCWIEQSAGAYAFPERRDEVYRNVERASALFRALERRSQRAPLLLGDEELLATYDFGEDAAGAAQEMHDWQRNYGAATATAEQPFGDVRSLAPVSLRALDESCTAWLRGYTRTAYAFVSERIAEVRQSVAAQTALALEAMENVSASLFFSEARDCITLRVMVRGIDATRDILVPLQMPISGFLFYVFEYVTPHISPDLAVMRLPWMAWHRAHAPSNPLIPLLELASSLPTSKGAKNKRPSTFAALLNSECHRLGLDRNATSFRLADYFLTLRLQNYWAIRSTTPMRNSTIGELESRRAVPASPGASASAQAVAVQ